MVMSGRSVHLKRFFWGQVNQYFVHTLSLVTDNNPSGISGREENDRRSYFIINLHESMGPDRDQTCDSDTYLQSDTLPTALRGPVTYGKAYG